MTNLLVIILARNEALHIERTLASVKDIATQTLVVDSGATDGTVAIAKAAGAKVVHHKWHNYATQFNWALDHVAGFDGWILRLDADEAVTPELAAEIGALGSLPADVDGVYVGRRMNFMRKPVRHGGLFPARMIRLFRNGAGRCENRWMDEHIVVQSRTVDFSGCIIDDNQNTLDWWVAKHNAYASREVVDILNQRYDFMPSQSVARLRGGRQDQVKRWVKENLYARLPGGLRAGFYFFYRYVIRLGFLDGAEGRRFHVLQGFWYRYLVDAKLAEVQAYMARTGAGPVDAIRDVLGLSVTDGPAQSERQAA